MNKNFEEQEKKAKVGVRLAREEVFKLVFGAEATEATSDELKQDFDIYLQNDEKFIATLNENQLEFIRSSINGIAENYDNIKDIIKKNTKNWAYERIGTVERALLIVATYEFIFKNTHHFCWCVFNIYICYLSTSFYKHCIPYSFSFIFI